MKKRVFNFNLPDELRDYLKEKSKTKHSNMSAYLIGLIEQDKKDWEEVLFIKEKGSIEGEIIKTIVNRIFLKYSFEPFYKDIEDDVVKEIKENMDRLLKGLEYEVRANMIEVHNKSWNQELNGNIMFKKEGSEEVRNIDFSLLNSAKSLSKNE